MFFLLYKLFVLYIESFETTVVFVLITVSSNNAYIP
jgi:hypothetical protein